MNTKDIENARLLIMETASAILKNKAIIEGRVYVVDLDENFVCLGIPQPTKCNFEISQTNQIALYATRPRLREIYDALKAYYGDTGS